MTPEQRRIYFKEWLKKKYASDPEYKIKERERRRMAMAEKYHSNQKFRESRIAYQKAHDAVHREELRVYQKAYRLTHKLELREYYRKRKNRLYATDPAFRERIKEEAREVYNTPAYRTYANAYKARRKLADPSFKLAANLRRRINMALHGTNKSASTLALIGCTIEQLKVHLEAQFQPGMSWENYGYRGWHVDHRAPLAVFSLSDPSQQKAAFNFTNLQPMWWRDNISKGAKV